MESAGIGLPTMNVEACLSLARISPALRERMAKRMARDNKLDYSLACEIVDETAKFLAMKGVARDVNIVPSALVDIGWHTFLMYTKDYLDFSRRVTGGRFIHHEPMDSEENPQNTVRGDEVMRKFGVVPNEKLWRACNDACSSSGEGCHMQNCCST